MWDCSRSRSRRASLDVAGVAIALVVCAVVVLGLLFLTTTGLGEFRRTIDIKLAQEEQGGVLRALLASTGTGEAELPARWLVSNEEGAVNGAPLAQQAAEVGVGAELATAERTLAALQERLGLDGARLTVTANGVTKQAGPQPPRLVRTYVAEVPLPGGTGERGRVVLAIW